jgi:hypothetical protein
MRRELYDHIRREAKALPDYNELGSKLANAIQELLGDET